MEFSTIMNMIVCIATSASSFAYVHTLSKNIATQEKSSLSSLKSLMTFWSLVGTYFLLAGINIYLTNNPTIAGQSVLFRVNIIIFGLMSIPMIYTITYILIDNQKLVYLTSALFILIDMMLLGTIVTSNITGPVLTYWGPLFVTETMNMTIAYLATLFIIPIAMIFGFLLLIGIGKLPLYFGEKLVFSLVSISFVFDFIFLDVIAQTGEMQMASRIFAFLGTVFGYLAYLSSHKKEEQLPA